MAEVLLFHHTQGLTRGVHAFADNLRASGHTVHMPDLFDGRIFQSIDEEENLIKTPRRRPSVRPPADRAGILYGRARLRCSTEKSGFTSSISSHIAARLLMAPGAAIEAGEVEARHVRARRQRQPPLEGGLRLVEAAEGEQGPSEEMQRHVELRVEPIGPRIERHSVFVPALEIPDVAEAGIGVGEIRGEAKARSAARSASSSRRIQQSAIASEM